MPDRLKTLFIAIVIHSTWHLAAYELPKIDLSSDDNPKILTFTATNIMVEEKPSYLLKWKTLNATDVSITFIGKVALSGDLSITEEEYNRGAITLRASSKTSSHIDTKTINDNKNALTDPSMVFTERSDDEQYYYNTMPYRRGMRNPYRRGIYSPYRRRY